MFKICATCNKKFETKNDKRKYCSIKCYHLKSPKVERICEGCGKVFLASPHQLKDGKGRYCSKKCAYANYNKTSHPIRLTCFYCGNEFYRPRTKFRAETKNVFCSEECHLNWRRKGGNPSGKNHPEYSSIEIECANCGKILIRQPHRANGYNYQFCDKKCFGEWRSKNITGKDHPRWKGGDQPGYRGPNWAIQAKATRKRDGYKCQYCGMSQKKNGKKLDVHHIIPFRDFGYIPDENDNYIEANQLTNLISLCRTCHQLAEHRKIPVQPRLL